jgi:hypothetical protein
MFPHGTHTNLIGGYTNVQATPATALAAPSFRLVPVATFSQPALVLGAQPVIHAQAIPVYQPETWSSYTVLVPPPSQQIVP